MKKILLCIAILSIVTAIGLIATDSKDSAYADENSIAATQQTVIYAEDRIVNLGETYDPMEGVSAIDVDGTDITNKVQVISPTGNTSVINTFPIVYTVTDSTNTVVNKVIMAEVKPFYRPNPIFSFTVDNYLNGFKVKQGTDIQAFVKNLGITAKDADNKDITDSIVVDYSQFDTNKVGVQHLFFTATDAYGKYSTADIHVTVEKDEPIIEDTSVLTVTDLYLKKGDVWNHLDGVKASVNGIDITMGVLLVEDDVDTSKVGTYHATYRIYGSDRQPIDRIQTIYVR